MIIVYFITLLYLNYKDCFKKFKKIKNYIIVDK